MSTEPTETVVYTYTSTTEPREYYTGVPARDLTEEDVAALTDEQRVLLDEGTLYERVAQRTSRSRKAKNGEPAEPDTTEPAEPAEPDTSDTPATPAPAEG